MPGSENSPTAYGSDNKRSLGEFLLPGMAKQCAICGKGSMLVWRRIRLRATKFNPTVKRRQYPNLQWTRLPNGKRVLACAKCIKATAKRK